MEDKNVEWERSEKICSEKMIRCVTYNDSYTYE